jgi:hypothetical protein
MNEPRSKLDAVLSHVEISGFSEANLYDALIETLKRAHDMPGPAGAARDFNGASIRSGTPRSTTSSRRLGRLKISDGEGGAITARVSAAGSYTPPQRRLMRCIVVRRTFQPGNDRWSR